MMINWPRTWQLWHALAAMISAEFEIPPLRAWQMARRLLGPQI